uniref:tRNA-uridine aminocarboxypropyltransferase n=1 Tax=Aegilops tauschii subsp. strangulata TaxID=200361 RepID=A0A453S8W3_AEGTS
MSLLWIVQASLFFQDFLRQNNTGKLLWQVFGIQAASLCLFGIQEHEDIMWDAFQRSGKEKVSFLYPNKSATPKSVNDLKFDDFTMNAGLQEGGVQHEPLNLVLLDGTWSNSAALYRRLKERWTAIWGEEDIPCISLSMLSASVMHKLRPQPAWDRTCTAAAAAGLLSELHMRPELSAFKLEEQAEAVECSLDILLDALTVRRVRLGRSITRKQRHRRDCI